MCVRAVGLTCSGSLLRQLATNSLNGFEKGPSSVGGLFLGMRNSTRMGWRSALGGSPRASSMAVTPRDQISACGGRGREDKRGTF